LLQKEYEFCNKNIDIIQNKAQVIYNMVINNFNSILTSSCCDFLLLEQKSIEYASLSEVASSVDDVS